jgi:TldD protein
MTRGIRLLLIVFCLAGGAASSFAQGDVVMKAMHDELDRSMKQLRLEALDKPYFIAYRVSDRRTATVSATLGSLTASQQSHTRSLSVEVRVGDYTLDNTNFVSFNFGPAGVARGFGNTVTLPLEDDYKEIRRQIWLATDSTYKKALQDLARKRAALENKTRRDDIPDFSKEEPAMMEEKPAAWDLDPIRAESQVRKLSQLFQDLPGIYRSSVQMEASDDYTRYLNSEGTEFTRGASTFDLIARAATQAADGTPLNDAVAVYARSMSGLPNDEELISQIKEMGTRLGELRAAPVADQYNGPVLFEGQASAALFAQAFVPKVLAARRPVADNPQFEMIFARSENPFQDRLGARVLPDWAGIVDDPTKQEEKGKPLWGGYSVDDEGVRARETALVSDGVLKSLLSSRDPVRGLQHSTANDRGFGVAPSNVFFVVKNGLSDAAMKEKLLNLAQQRGMPFGIVVRRLANPLLGDPQDMLSSMMGSLIPGLGGGGGATRPALVAYEVFPDGREKLVRNAQLEGLNESSFKDLVAASAGETVYSTPFFDIGSVFGRVFTGAAFSGDMQTPIVSLTVPNLVFEDVTVNPPSQEIPKPPFSKPPFEK